jgi:hypothetical protein
MMMKKIIKYFLYFVLCTLYFSSCDKVKEPYSNATNGGDSTAVKTRKLLLEEFTGHTCVNCPKGALTVHSIQNEFPGKVISVAYHAGYYAKPETGASIFTQDFRTTVGEAYVSAFSITAFPSAMISRKHFPSSTDQWRDTIVAFKDVAPDAFLTIKNSYVSSTRALTCTVKCEFLNMLSGDYNLIVFLTEDSIVAPQKNGQGSTPADPAYPAGNVTNYVNNHMVRDCISDINGAGFQIVTGSAAAGDSASHTFTYTLPANFNGVPPIGSSPVEKHCNVVAFLYNTATMEVIQAEEAKMQ